MNIFIYQARYTIMCIVVLQMRCLGPRLFVYQSFNISFNVGSGKSKTRIQCCISHPISRFLFDLLHSRKCTLTYIQYVLSNIECKVSQLGQSTVSLQTNFQKLSWFSFFFASNIWSDCSSHSSRWNSGNCVSTLIFIRLLSKRRLGFSFQSL